MDLVSAVTTTVMCLHCKYRVMSRPRGLCRACYFITHVRRLYAPATRTNYKASPIATKAPLSSPIEPTTARPGSEEKIGVLTKRAAAGVNLWHPLDAPMDGKVDKHDR